MYVNKNTLQVLEEDELRNSFPDTIFPEHITQDHLSDTDFVIVNVPIKPIIEIYQTLTLSAPFINSQNKIAVRWIVNTRGLDANLKTDLIMVLRDVFENYLTKLTESYPRSELDSWTKQETEARNYLLDNNYPTPFIDALSTARNMDKYNLVLKIVEKANLFATESAKLIGERQRLEDAIMAATTLEQLPVIPQSINYE